MFFSTIPKTIGHPCLPFQVIWIAKRLFISIRSYNPASYLVNEISCALRIPYCERWQGGGVLPTLP